MIVTAVDEFPICFVMVQGGIMSARVHLFPAQICINHFHYIL